MAATRVRRQCPAAGATRAPGLDLWTCAGPRCGAGCAGHELLARNRAVDGVAQDLCGICWIDLDCPPRARAATPIEVFEAQRAARERMLRKGGNARYMVRAGKA